MLDNYHLLLASLDESETLLLEDQLSELRRIIRPGAKRLNWTALAIQDYIIRCKTVRLMRVSICLKKNLI
jgi:dynein heavy chain, axonemal